MTGDKHNLWQAYLDGELSVAETAEFEASLTEAERERLASEMRFENGMAERLSHNATCPIEVWKRTQAMLRECAAKEKAGAASGPSPFRRWYWGMATIAAAATIALVFATFAPVPRGDYSAIVMAAASVDELAEQSTQQGDKSIAEEFLRALNFDLHLNEESSLGMAAIHHDIKVVGVHQSALEGDPVAEIFFGCCDYPVKIILAQKGSAAAKRIGLAAADGGQVQATRVIGDYVTAVVGKHPAYDLLDIFGDDHEYPDQEARGR